MVCVNDALGRYVRISNLELGDVTEVGIGEREASECSTKSRKLTYRHHAFPGAQQVRCDHHGFAHGSSHSFSILQGLVRAHQLQHLCKV